MLEHKVRKAELRLPRPISLFTSYSAKENRVTNYCGLILKLLYERSPRAFDDAIARLTAGTVQISTKVVFTQQEHHSHSTPDLVISQEPFALFFETKLDDWHYSEQIGRHIKSMADNAGKKVLFLLANFEEDDNNTKFKQAIEAAKLEGISLVCMSYTDLLDALDKADLQKLIATEIEEFRDYLDREQLLSTWRDLLDVVNCGRTLEEIKDGAYMCPDTGGAYSHRRCRFFGPYANKKVASICDIDGVVSVSATNPGHGALEAELVAEIRFNNTGQPPAELRAQAIEKIRGWRADEVRKYPMLVFLLGDSQPTEFIKDTPGGMFTSKIYFTNFAKARTCKDAAHMLQGKTWNDWWHLTGSQ